MKLPSESKGGARAKCKVRRVDPTTFCTSPGLQEQAARAEIDFAAFPAGHFFAIALVDPGFVYDESKVLSEPERTQHPAWLRS